MQYNHVAYPVNPTATQVETHKAYAKLAEIPGPIHAVSIITPHPITERLVEDRGALGIKHLWMQPGVESPKAVARARELGMKTEPRVGRCDREQSENEARGEACVLRLLAGNRGTGVIRAGRGAIWVGDGYRFRPLDLRL